MSSNTENNEYDPVANLNMQPAKGILKSTRSIDDPGQDTHQDTTSSSLNDCPTTGMTRSESKRYLI
jgi:hypothetical protein